MQARKINQDNRIRAVKQKNNLNLAYVRKKL